MTDQFSKPNFARGVRLCVEHVYVTLADMKTQAENANIENQVDALAPCRIAWHCPWIGAESAQEGKPVAFWPFTIPPFQQDFVRDRLSDPGYPVVLRELSVAFDQGAEPEGITSPESTSSEGKRTAPDMDRYDLTIRLFEKQPTATGGSASIVPREVLRLELDGVNAYGNEFARLNPFTIDTLNVRLKPFMVYYWQVECPGLYSEDGDPLFGAPTVEQLAMPSFTLVATVLSPLTVRDQLDDFAFPGIQNIPAKHGGLKTGTTISLVTPVADTIITGTDVQTALGGFDEAARERMPSGYGTGHGATGNVMQAADRPPSELLEKDAYLSVIMVPMWHGQRNNSIRASDVPTMGMPFAPDPFVAPWLTPTMDRRVLRVPSNFVIHHVFAVWNNWSPVAQIVGHAAVGTESTAATYQQEVGVAIHSGFKGDDYRMQQVAFLRWTGANASTFTLDSLTVNGAACFRILNVPLVNPVAPLWDDNTWQASGRPFFVGDANTTTAGRTQAGVMPSAFGGGAFATPATQGKETMLEIRWEKSDPTVGLDGGPADDVRVGQGGEWVILVGRQTVAA